MSATDRLPVLVGEAPSKSGDRYHMVPLSGAVAERLCGLAGIDPLVGESRYGRWTWALYERFECVNLFERYAEATPWSAPAARERAIVVHGEHAPGAIFVLLGRKVSAAFGHDADFYEWVGGTVSIPHPSGLNRLLNDPEQRERCGDALRHAMRLNHLLAGGVASS